MERCVIFDTIIGRYLAIPETPRESSTTRCMPYEWASDLDVAARFPDAAAARRCEAFNATRHQVLSLAEAWALG